MNGVHLKDAQDAPPDTPGGRDAEHSTIKGNTPTGQVIDLDVIDDYFAEAVEVSRVGNGWLTYARPQHDYNQRKLGKPELLRFEALLTLDIR